jgi:hypothetical protein
MSFDYITEHKDLKFKIGDLVFIDTKYMNEVDSIHSDLEYVIIGIKQQDGVLMYKMKVVDDNFYIEIACEKVVNLEDLWISKLKTIE